MSAPVLNRTDPRAKLVVLLTFVVLFFLPVPLPLLAGYLALAALLFPLAADGEGLGRTLRSILPFLLLILLLTPPFRREGRVLLAPFGFPLVTTPGLLEALRLAVRFSGITLAFALFTRTTLAEELLASLRTLGVPFSAALVVTLTLRTIPRIVRIHRNLVDAQSLRQAGRGPGRHPAGRAARGRARRVSVRLPELAPVLVQAVRGIPLLAMVLESRGLGRKDRRTRYLALKTGWPLAGDLAASALLAGLLAASAALVR